MGWGGVGAQCKHGVTLLDRNLNGGWGHSAPQRLPRDVAVMQRGAVPGYAGCKQSGCLPVCQKPHVCNREKPSCLKSPSRNGLLVVCAARFVPLTTSALLDTCRVLQDSYAYKMPK